MPGTQLDYVVQAFVWSINGFGYAGSGESCKLPPLSKKTEKFRGGGMLMERTIALGYNGMEMEVDLAEFDPNALSQGGLYLGNRTLTSSLRGYMDGDNNAQHTAIIQTTGEVTDLAAGTWKPGTLAKLKAKLALSAITLQIDGNTIWNIDAQNGVYQVGGTDQYAAVKAALGL